MAQKIWQGAAGDGGDGVWSTSGDWSPAGAPAGTADTANNVAAFQADETHPEADAEVSISGGSTAQAFRLQVGYGKSVVIKMGTGATLNTGASGINNVGMSLGTGTGAAGLSIQGPASGTATVSLGRVLSGGGSSLVFSGPVTVTDPSKADTDIGRTGNYNSMSVLDGAKVTRFGLWVTHSSTPVGEGIGNEILVEDSGSRLTVDNRSQTGNTGLRIGSAEGDHTYANASRDNRMIVNEGGSVAIEGNYLTIGATYARSNYVLVTGEDSLLELSSSVLRIGNVLGSSVSYFGGNHLSVENGASVRTNGLTTIISNPTQVTNDGANRLTIGEGGTFASSNAIEVSGLLQLAGGGVLEGGDLTGNPAALSVAVNAGARFEAEGTGLASNVSTAVSSTGTFAVGLIDPATQSRSEAKTLTLDSTVTFSAGSFLEISLFDSGPEGIDQITFGANGLLTGDVKLRLVLRNGYAPEGGMAWTLFEGNTPGITASFNLSGLDPEVWDVSNFNQAGGWQIAVVPEPSSVTMLFVGLGGALFFARRRLGQRHR